MTRRFAAVIAVGVVGPASLGGTGVSAADEDAPLINGRVIASGIPGASAVSAVGTFLLGGPIHDNPVQVSADRGGVGR
jgi:hypothetical protein